MEVKRMETYTAGELAQHYLFWQVLELQRLFLPI